MENVSVFVIEETASATPVENIGSFPEDPVPVAQLVW
jgi:hypothetical protein